MMALPALIDGEGPILFESLAIIEYLDETHPNPPLLPRDARGRRARAGPRTNRRLRFTPADRAARAPPRNQFRSTRRCTRLFQRVRAGEGVDRGERISANR
jgi:glutathione S-transferase